MQNDHPAGARPFKPKFFQLRSRLRDGPFFAKHQNQPRYTQVLPVYNNHHQRHCHQRVMIALVTPRCTAHLDSISPLAFAVVANFFCFCFDSRQSLPLAESLWNRIWQSRLFHSEFGLGSRSSIVITALRLGSGSAVTFSVFRCLNFAQQSRSPLLCSPSIGTS